MHIHIKDLALLERIFDRKVLRNQSRSYYRPEDGEYLTKLQKQVSTTVH